MRRPVDLRIVWLAGWLAGWRLTGGSAAEGPKIGVSLCVKGLKKHCRKGGNL